MNFQEYLKTNAQAINEKLDLILQDFLNEVKKTNIRLLPFALGLINCCKGGKRIRGVLVKLGYEIAGREDGRWKVDDREEIIKIGAAFEILHTALLIHDDIIDQSPLRRGKQSLYKALGGDHYGISQAISVGDIGLYLPIKIIAQSNFLGEYKLKALECFSQMLINTGWGQIMDVEVTLKKGSDEDIKFIRTFKTAKYTIAGPLQLGAILSGADDRLLKMLGEFGESLGIAFQIKDDILDGEVGDIDFAKAEALEYSLQAKRIIPKLTKDRKLQTMLEEMIDYLIERDR